MVIACFLWSSLRLSSVQGGLFGRHVTGFTRFSKIQVALYLSLNLPSRLCKSLLVNVKALQVPKTLFDHLDSVLVYQISSFSECVFF